MEFGLELVDDGGGSVRLGLGKGLARRGIEGEDVVVGCLEQGGDLWQAGPSSRVTASSGARAPARPSRPGRSAG